MKQNFRSRNVGHGTGLRLAYVLGNKDISQIEDALRAADSLRDAVRSLERVKRATRRSASERRRVHV